MRQWANIIRQICWNCLCMYMSAGKKKKAVRKCQRYVGVYLEMACTVLFFKGKNVQLSLR